MASTYLTRTATANNNSVGKWTFSCWVKRSSIASDQNIISFFSTSNYRSALRFESDNKLRFYEVWNGSSIVTKLTNRLFRDTNAWYHIVLAVDKTVSSPDTQIYINGEATTSWATNDDYSQNESGKFNDAEPIYIGTESGSGGYFDGLMSHVHFVDGTAYPASTFGETDSVTGEWKIIAEPSGINYGTNGFFILKDGNSVTDQSSNSNNFTVGGGTLTNTKDNPSNNFCTFNAVNPYSGVLSNGNLKMSQTNFNINVQGSLGMESGKYYWEYKIDGLYGEFGVCEQGKAGQSDPQGNIGFYFLYNNGNTTGYIWNNATAGSQSSEITIPAFASGMIINLAYDADNKALYIGQNGTWLNSGDPTSGASTTGALVTNLYPRFGGTIVPFCGHGTSSTTANYEANFGCGFFGTTEITTNSGNGYAGAEGASKFAYQPPANYSALNTKGLNE